MITCNLNAKPVLDGLDAFAASIADVAPALQTVADDFREMIEEQFATQGSAGGTPWAPLAPSTLRRRRGGLTILESTGALRGSLTDAGAFGHVEAFDGFTASGPSLNLGSELPFAIFHQTGTGIGFGETEVPSAVQFSKPAAGAFRMPRAAGERKMSPRRAPRSTKKPSRPAPRQTRASAGPGRGRALPMRPIIVLTDERQAQWIEMVRQSVEQKTAVLGAEELG